MEPAPAPEIHNPAKLWDDEIARKQKEIKAVPSQNAPRDLVSDIRKEPEWLIPEIRQWTTLHLKVREAKVDWLTKLKAPKEGEVGITADDAFKKKCFRWLLTVEPDGVLARKMFDFIWPGTVPTPVEEPAPEVQDVPPDSPFRRRGRPRKVATEG